MNIELVVFVGLVAAGVWLFVSSIRERMLSSEYKGEIVEIRKKKLCNEHGCRYEYCPIYKVYDKSNKAILFSGSWTESRPNVGAKIRLMIRNDQTSVVTVWSRSAFVVPACLLFTGAIGLITLALR